MRGLLITSEKNAGDLILNVLKDSELHMQSMAISVIKELPKSINDAYLNVSVLRGEIRKGIEEACRIQKCNINAQPATVSEA